MHVSINKELKIECEKELDNSIFDNWSQTLLWSRNVKRSILGFSCAERGSYMNMFLWLLDFVAPSNNIFRSFSIWYVIIQLSLSDSSYIIWL